MLTDAQLKQYEDEGYVICGRILDDDELSRLRAEIRIGIIGMIDGLARLVREVERGLTRVS